MSADPQLHDRLERAAAYVPVDAEWRLEEIHGRSSPRGYRVRRVATFALAAALALASVAIASRLLPVRERPDTPGAPAGPAGRIAYMSLTKPLTEKDSSDLFVLDVASGQVASLHQGTGFSVWPRWSPDGSLVAYASNETGNDRIGIFVAHADGTEPVNILGDGRMLENGGPSALSWSPDGSRIAFAGKDLRTGRVGVWTVNADGTDERAVLDGHWESVSWSPDGERLLLPGVPATDAQSEQFDLYTVRLDGSGLLRLTHDGLVERAPSWSPDGTRIVFAERTVEADNPDYGQDVFVMDADGSNVRRVTEWAGFDSFPVWAPDGRWIAFASDRDATSEQRLGNGTNRPFAGVSLYVMRPDGSDVIRVLDGGAVALLPSSWMP